MENEQQHIFVKHMLQEEISVYRKLFLKLVYIKRI